MKSLGEVLKLSTQYLEERRIVSPRRQAEELLSCVLGLERLQLYLQFDRPFEENELQTFRKFLFRRGKGEPLDYIIGSKSFFHCEIEVAPSVLIPRPETEIFLDLICRFIQSKSFFGKHAWDICCGSGCLGIGLKKALPSLNVSLSDLSKEALTIANKNIIRNGVEVSLFEGDLFEPFAGRKADFVLCNPPYIAEKDYEALDPEVKYFEPKMALVSGSSGYEFYERLAKELPGFLNPKANVFLELGTGQGERVLSIFSSHLWKSKKVEKDWSGHDRFFFLEFE